MREADAAGAEPGPLAGLPHAPCLPQPRART